MSAFDFKAFSTRMIAEALFYDEEYGAIGNMSLVNEEEQKEYFIAYYLPEEEHFVIDEATEWEDYDPEEEAAIGYALAIDTDEFMVSKSQIEIAETVLALAEEHNLMPSAALFFEEETD